MADLNSDSPAANLSEVRTLLLDIDGTIFSSEEMIVEIYKDVFGNYREKFGRPAHIPGRDEIMAQIGKPVRTIFANLVPELPLDEQEAVGEQILSHLVRRILAGEGHYYDGALDSLHELHGRGYKLIAASNGRRPYVESILTASKLIEIFTDIPAVDNVKIFDKNELVADALKRHGLAPSEAVMVGDRTSDRDAARHSAVPFIGCLYGHGTADELEGAIALIESAGELPYLLK